MKKVALCVSIWMSASAALLFPTAGSANQETNSKIFTRAIYSDFDAAWKKAAARTPFKSVEQGPILECSPKDTGQVCYYTMKSVMCMIEGVDPKKGKDIRTHVCLTSKTEDYNIMFLLTRIFMSIVNKSYEKDNSSLNTMGEKIQKGVERFLIYGDDLSLTLIKTSAGVGLAVTPPWKPSAKSAD